MQQEGVNLGDNQTHLLAKIEELTLYLIEQDKRASILEEKLKQLNDQNQALADRNKTLEDQNRRLRDYDRILEDLQQRIRQLEQTNGRPTTK
jgi:predicted RNase H-like nuclease (RuvC/YqgF family)